MGQVQEGARPTRTWTVSCGSLGFAPEGSGPGFQQFRERAGLEWAGLGSDRKRLGGAVSSLRRSPLKASGRPTGSREPALNALGTLWVEARPGLRGGARERPTSCTSQAVAARGRCLFCPAHRHAPEPLSGPGPCLARCPQGAMASRLLHRLRHALASDGPGEAAAGPEAEQFPESSELEDDDAEGLSSRLSGTLSFTSAEDDPDDEDEDDEAGPDSPPSGDGTSGEDAGECGKTEAGTSGLG